MLLIYLEGVDALAELLPVQRVRDGRVHAALAQTDHLRRDADTTLVEETGCVFVTADEWLKSGWNITFCGSNT